MTEGIVPVMMYLDDFFIAGKSWVQFHSFFPNATFAEFWHVKYCSYQRRNIKSNEFWATFDKDPVGREKILAERRLRREIKRITNTSIPYQPPAGLLELKPEPVEDSLSVPMFEGAFECRLQRP